MGLFSKTMQRITISSKEQDALETLASDIRARKLRGTKVSSLQHVGDQWQCTINCKLAETIYYQEVVPLLYGSADTQSFEVLLEFDDEGQLVAQCPKELLLSFSLPSRYAYGNQAEHEFMQQLHRDILQSSPDAPAAITYYIVSGGAVTMCVPSADPKAMEHTIKNKLAAHKIRQFMIKVAAREPA